METRSGALPVCRSRDRLHADSGLLQQLGRRRGARGDTEGGSQSSTGKDAAGPQARLGARRLRRPGIPARSRSRRSRERRDALLPKCRRRAGAGLEREADGRLRRSHIAGARLPDRHRGARRGRAERGGMGRRHRAQGVWRSRPLQRRPEDARAPSARPGDSLDLRRSDRRRELLRQRGARPRAGRARS